MPKPLNEMNNPTQRSLTRLNGFFLCRGVPLAQLDVDVSIGDGTRTMAGIVAHVFARSMFDVLRDPCMTQPVHRRRHHEVGFLLKAILTHSRMGAGDKSVTGWNSRKGY